MRRRLLGFGLHAGMTAVMVAAMVAHSAPVALVSAVVLLAAAVVVARAARSDPTWHGHLADLVAMGAALVVSVMGAVSTPHGHGTAPRVLLIAVIAVWIVTRLVLMRRAGRIQPAAVVTAVGLGLMAAM